MSKEPAATTEPAERRPATAVPAVPAHIARRARELVDAVFDPPPPAPPPAPPPPSATTLAARRIVAEAEAAAAARRVEEEEQASQAALEQSREAAAQQAREEAEEQARQEAEEQARQEAEEQARQEAEEQARQEAEEQARQEADEQERRQAEQRAREEAAQQVPPSAATPDPATVEGAAAKPEVESDLRIDGPPQPDEERLFPPDQSDTAALFPEQPPAPPISPATGRGAPHPDPAPEHGPDPAPELHRDVDQAQVAARLAAEALEHRERSQDVDRDDDHTAFLEPSPGRRAGRWLLVTILAAVALAWLLPVTIAAVLELVSLS